MFFLHPCPRQPFSTPSTLCTLVSPLTLGSLLHPFICSTPNLQPYTPSTDTRIRRTPCISSRTEVDDSSGHPVCRPPEVQQRLRSDGAERARCQALGEQLSENSTVTARHASEISAWKRWSRLSGFELPKCIQRSRQAMTLGFETRCDRADCHAGAATRRHYIDV